MLDVASYGPQGWTGATDDDGRNVASAITGETVARVRSAPGMVGAMLDHARTVGGPALREMGFHDRARLLKALALHLGEHKEELYRLSRDCGSTRADAMIDVDGGIGTLFVFASKGRRELPDGHVWRDGAVETFARDGSFVGQHILAPRLGAAVQINAFNFPVWGMLEKLAPALLAGVASIVKPATQTSFVTAACFRRMVESGLLPDGAVQLLVGETGDLLDRLGAQDSLAFTGSFDTGLKLRSHPNLLRNAVPFTAEQDSLNATVLGADAEAGSPEFGLLVREVVREMTAKAGQKCTAIRRILVPAGMVDAVAEAVAAKLAGSTIGDPLDEGVRMGALVSLAQRADVADKVASLRDEARLIFGEDDASFAGVDRKRGAFLAPHLLVCDDPDAAERVHDTEAFGPVSTILPYRDADHAVALLNRGGGSLVASVVTHDTGFATRVARGIAPWHGRVYLTDRDSAKSATGHGSPLPHMIHGGPGRAGGGEELGGVRAVAHHMQRTAVQGPPRLVAAVAETWMPGAPTHDDGVHPFTKTYGELELGTRFVSDHRQVTLQDIEDFARFTGDTFYAHMDEEAAAANPFFAGRVAHGYLLLSFAAGLFVQPDPGPVLANTGLSDLEFMKPVAPGDSIRATLTVQRRTRRTEAYGEVRWRVDIDNGEGEAVARYVLHTMNAYERG